MGAPVTDTPPELGVRRQLVRRFDVEIDYLVSGDLIDRLIAKLEAVGAPISREPRDINDRAKIPSGLRITVEGLHELVG